MERVVLLDDSGRAIGSADKATVHHENTPLHLAFSCYVVNDHNEVLLTRRAGHKKTWPGVWTNSCCGHPAPGEELSAAVARRLREELGMETSRAELLLPGFRYRATMQNGIAENEICPVFHARANTEPRPDPAEVDGHRWMPWAEFLEAVSDGAFEVSPWCGKQVRELTSLGPDARRWPTALEHVIPAANNTAEAGKPG